MSDCCSDKKLEKQVGAIKSDKRKLQTQLDTIKSQKQQLQVKYTKQAQQQEKLYKKLKEKDETIENIQENAKIFKINFHRQLTSNDKKAKETFTKVQNCTLLSQLQLNQINLTYESMELFFSPQLADIREQIIALLQSIYNLLNGEYYNERKLILSIKRYNKVLKEIVTQGYNEKEDQQLILAREFLSKNFSDFFKELEELIKLNREKYSKEKSKILEESGIESNNEELKLEIKLQQKVTELELFIQNLKQEKEKAQQENQRFQTITIPKLREELQKKEAKEFDEIKHSLHKIENKFIEKDQLLSKLEDVKGQIRNIVYSSSDQEMVDIIKVKDIKITQLEKKIAQKESKMLSQWTQQTELSNSKKVEAEILIKDIEIQNLKRSLNEQKMAFEEISSQMVQKEKRLSNQFVIQENILTKEKQNINLSSELQKANQKINNLQKQLDISQQTASKEAAQINSQLTEKQRQLAESKARAKLLLDDNTTQKEKRAILSSQFTEKERQIQALKQELGSLSSENQALSIQLQQILTLSQSFELKNQQLRQQLENSKKNQKLSPQNDQQLPQKENNQEENNIHSLKNQFIIQRQKLQNSIDELKKSNDSLAITMQNIKKKHSAQLQQKVFAYSSLQLNFNNLQVQKFELQNQIKSLSKELKQIKLQAKERQSLFEFRRNATEQIQTLKQSLEKERKIVFNLQSEVMSLKKVNMKMGQKIQQLSSSNQSSRMRSASFVEHRTLFIGEILEKKKVQKKFLMSSIETVMKQQIEKTVKIYEYKRDKSINPHSFIDGHSNLVVIVQTQKALIAAYYSGELQSKTPMTSEALILSLDNRKYYQLKENNKQSENRTPKGMVYDQYYIIFGNTQLSIRSGEAKIFSNFGSLSGFFNPKGDKINSLFRDGSNNEVELINYEIHQVIFDENYVLEST